MVQTYHETLYTLNNSEFEIKFLSINWYNFTGYLVSWGDGSLFNFHYHWNFKRKPNLQHVSPKL